jgi:hypothetical protein
LPGMDPIRWRARPNGCCGGSDRAESCLPPAHGRRRTATAALSCIRRSGYSILHHDEIRACAGLPLPSTPRMLGNVSRDNPHLGHGQDGQRRAAPGSDGRERLQFAPLAADEGRPSNQRSASGPRLTSNEAMSNTAAPSGHAGKACVVVRGRAATRSRD